MSIRSYFTFSRRERLGILALVIILLVVAVLPHFIRTGPVGQPVASKEPEQANQNLPPVVPSAMPDAVADRPQPGEAASGREGVVDRGFYRRPFYGDGRPWRRRNPAPDWNRDRAAKGYPQPGEARAVPSRPVGLEDRYRDRFSGRSAPWADRKPVEINIADTTAFIRLPGIGSKLAARIVAFRARLGGLSQR